MSENENAADKDGKIETSVSIDSDFEKIKLIYEQTSKMHQGIADFRAKLLALLPIASGVGIFLLLGKDLTPNQYPYLSGIGLFGIVVTIGLAIYEMKGINHCLDLQDVAKIHERLIILGVVSFKESKYFRRELRGPFEGRGIRGRKQSKNLKTGLFAKFRLGVRQASTIVYSSVIAGWGYVAAVGVASIIKPPCVINDQNLISASSIISYNLWGVPVATLVFLFSLFVWRKVLAEPKKTQLPPKKELPEISKENLPSFLKSLLKVIKDNEKNPLERYIAVGEILASIIAARDDKDYVSTLAYIKSAEDRIGLELVDDETKSAIAALELD